MLVLFSLTAPVLIGMVALGVEGGALYLKKATTQSVADMAAVSAAYAAQDGAALDVEAKAVAAMHGFVDGVDGAQVTVNNPPTSGSSAGDSSAIEVVVKTVQQPMLSKPVHSAAYTISSRAVATIPAGGQGCILALDATASPSVSVAGSANLNVPTCNIFSNSSAANSIYSQDAASAMTAKQIATVGGVSGPNITAGVKKTGASSTTNPYADLAVPSYSGCAPSLSSAKQQTINPGVYCGGFSITGNKTITMNPGVYIIDGGSLGVTSGSLIGTGVTIILTSQSPAAPATININGNATVDLTAPNAGAYAGVVLFIDPRTPANTTQTLNGGSSQYFGGAIVAPTSTISFKGNASATTGQSCTQIVAGKIAFTGNSALQSSCDSFGTKTIGSTGRAALKE